MIKREKPEHPPDKSQTNRVLQGGKGVSFSLLKGSLLLLFLEYFYRVSFSSHPALSSIEFSYNEFAATITGYTGNNRKVTAGSCTDSAAATVEKCLGPVGKR